VKWIGTSGPSRSTIQRVSASISAPESFRPGNEQRRDLEPDVGVVPQVLERLQYRLQVYRTGVGIETFGEALEIDVRCVHVRVELRPRLPADVSGGDGDGLIPRSRQAQETSIAHSRKTTGSLQVKATLAHPSACAASAIASGDAASASVSVSRDFRNVPVLAEAAGEIAAGGAEREHRAPGARSG
jgi:hypothetical protein